MNWVDILKIKAYERATAEQFVPEELIESARRRTTSPLAEYGKKVMDNLGIVTNTFHNWKKRGLPYALTMENIPKIKEWVNKNVPKRGRVRIHPEKQRPVKEKKPTTTLKPTTSLTLKPLGRRPKEETSKLLEKLGISRSTWWVWRSKGQPWALEEQNIPKIEEWGRRNVRARSAHLIEGRPRAEAAQWKETLKRPENYNKIFNYIDYLEKNNIPVNQQSILEELGEPPTIEDNEAIEYFLSGGK